MRLDWLEDILAVAETGSFSEAAERRHLTQSAFSRRIQTIEDHLGVELFDRTHKPVQLAAATQGQRDRIESLAHMLRQLSADLINGGKTSANRIVIVSQHALTVSLTPLMVEKIQSDDAEVHVKLVSANLDGCLAQLLSRQADIAILYRQPGTTHPVRADFVEYASIGRDRLTPLTGTGHVAALKAHIEAGRLHYVAYPADVFLGQVMERQVLQQLRRELTLVPRAETALTLAAVELAVSSPAIAWIPRSLAGVRIAAGLLTDLSGALPGADLEVTAVRLTGEPGPIQKMAWCQIIGGEQSS